MLPSCDCLWLVVFGCDRFSLFCAIRLEWEVVFSLILQVTACARLLVSPGGQVRRRDRLLQIMCFFGNVTAFN